MLRISRDERGSRLEALTAAVRQARLDMFLVSSFDSIYYLTGAGFEPLERPFFLLVRPEKAPTLLVPKLDELHMHKAHGIAKENVRTYWEYPAPAGRGWPERLKEEVGPAQAIGVEPTLRLEIADQLRDLSPRVEPLVERLRLTKSPGEIEMIRRAAGFADLGVQRLLAASYDGSTVAEGFAETRTVTTRIIRKVADWEPLTTRVIMASWAAPNSAMPHSIPGLNDRLRGGPHVALAFMRVNGYAAESERTYFTTRPTAEDRKAFTAMLEARRIALAQVRPGAACSEIDAAASEFLRREGYGTEDQRLHRTGHGIGLSNHEGPFLAEGSDDRLAENMVISVEPGIYLRGIGGFRHSDTVLVTKDGSELLTRLPADIDTLTLRGLKLWARLKALLVRWSLGLSRNAPVEARA